MQSDSDDCWGYSIRQADPTFRYYLPEPGASFDIPLFPPHDALNHLTARVNKVVKCTLNIKPVSIYSSTSEGMYLCYAVSPCVCVCVPVAFHQVKTDELAGSVKRQNMIKFDLESESHERRVERNWQQQVRSADHGHGQNGNEIRYLPAVRNERSDGKNDHTGNTNQTKSNGVLEALEDLWYFDEEVGELGFLGGSTPLHVVLEHVGEKGRGDVGRDHRGKSPSSGST